MEEERQQKKKSLWDSAAFRRKCVRFIAYIYVFFIVLNKRLSVKGKQRLAVAFCSCIVAGVIAFSLFGGNETKTALRKSSMDITLADNHNRVTGGQTGASIELNRSFVTGSKKAASDGQSDNTKDAGSKGDINTKKNSDRNTGLHNHVVANEKDSSAKRPNQVKEQAEEQTEMLSPVQALLENNGENRQGEAVEAELRYQYPARLGDDGKQNYDGVQSAADYIKRVVYHIGEEETKEGEEEQKKPDGEFADEKSPEGKPVDDADEKSAGQESPAPEASSEPVKDETDIPSTEESKEDPAADVVTADTGYFTVSGNRRSDASENVFASDITIKPTGVNGFDKVRLGEEGEFVSELVLTKEVVGESITLYFSDGKRVTSGVEYTYTKDTLAPVLAFDEGKYLKLQRKDKTIFCTNDSNIQVTASDDAGGVMGTGVDKLCYIYGDTLRYCINPSQSMGMEVPDNFYGQITTNCCDAAGNVSDIWSQNLLVENQAPQIQFSQDAFCTAPYTFWVNIGETGHIVSGIRDVKCSVNGKPFEINNLTILENTSLDEDLQVPTKCEFSLPLTEEGSYSVVVTVTDHAGNISTEEKVVEITKPELVSVFMPEKFAIHIDPQQLAGREQIYSDDITLKNDSDFDVQVTVKNIEVVVKDEISKTGVKKDCKMYLIAPDTGKKIPLKKGKNGNVYSYCLKTGTHDNIDKLRFVGDTSEGSDAMWQCSDVVIRMDLGFSKKE